MLGFDTDHRARFPIIGKDGVELSTQWGDPPEAYLGLAVPNVNSSIQYHDGMDETILRCPIFLRLWGLRTRSTTDL